MEAAASSMSGHIRADSVVDLAYERIRSMLVEGEIPPGARLGQVELAEQLGISRTPIREALRRLTGEGLAEFLPNRGFRAASPGLDDVLRRLEVRSLVEPGIARLAAQRRTDADLAALQRLDRPRDGRGHADRRARRQPRLPRRARPRHRQPRARRGHRGAVDRRDRPPPARRARHERELEGRRRGRAPRDARRGAAPRRRPRRAPHGRAHRRGAAALGARGAGVTGRHGPGPAPQHEQADLPALADREARARLAHPRDRRRVGVVRPPARRRAGAGPRRSPSGSPPTLPDLPGDAEAALADAALRARRERLPLAPAVPRLHRLERPRDGRARLRARRHLRREPRHLGRRRRPDRGAGAALGRGLRRLPARRGRVHQRRHDVEPHRAARRARARAARRALRRRRRPRGRRLLLRRGAPLDRARGRGVRAGLARRAPDPARRRAPHGPGGAGAGARRATRPTASSRSPSWPPRGRR